MNVKGKALSLGALAAIMLGNIGSGRNTSPFRTKFPTPAEPKKKNSPNRRYTPPVSMSEGTAYLYSKKPNIQFWQNKYGEKVIDKSVSELQAMGL